MRILQLYNRYQSGGRGETRVVELIQQTMTDRGHLVNTLLRDSQSINTTPAKVASFFSGAYSASARAEIRREINDWSPDVAHLHNLYPLFSPSVILACNELRVPVVMTVHNYGLTCPAATHFHEGKKCTRCLGGHEYHCVLGNCKDDIFKSAGYAYRSLVARTTKQFSGGVKLFLAVSNFLKQQLITSGFREGSVEVLENAVPFPPSPSSQVGEYVAFVGGMHAEKGVGTLLAAATRLPHFRFLFAGDGPERERWAAAAPPNCHFVGAQGRQETENIYRNARMVVVPSLWEEPFGLVAIEAMSHGKPVIAARSGGLTEIVEDGLTGLTFPPDDSESLIRAIAQLWNEPERAIQMGNRAYASAANRFGLERFGDRLIGHYKSVLNQEVSQ